MDKLPFETSGLKDNEIELLQDTYNLLESMYPIRYDKDYTYNLKDLEILSDYKRADIFAPFNLGSDNSAYITFTESEYTFRGSAKGGDMEAIEYQTWAIAPLTKNYGHIIIRPETFIDKIQNFFQHQKVDFSNDQAFNRRFFVLAKDKEMALLDLSNSFRELLLNFELKDFIIEILNNRLIIGNKMEMEPKQACYFAEFVRNVKL